LNSVMIFKKLLQTKCLRNLEKLQVWAQFESKDRIRELLKMLLLVQARKRVKIVTFYNHYQKIAPKRENLLQLKKQYWLNTNQLKTALTILMLTLF
jgi:NADH:ubiquinone oxidoreductase subunit E